MKPEFVDLREKDFDAVKEIYDYYILNSTATFHTEKVPVETLKETIPAGHPRYKSYLIKYGGNTCGYCYISQYKNRKAYDRTAEVTVYLMPGYTGKGFGKLALKKLEDEARQQGISVLIGIIAGDNDHSIKLFERCGYEKCAHFRKVGEKFNRILDVVAFQKILDE